LLLPIKDDKKHNVMGVEVEINEHNLFLLSSTWWDGKKEREFQCLFRDSSTNALPTASPNIETLTSTELTFFESIVTFFNNLLPF